jgi:hypothetical protein
MRFRTWLESENSLNGGIPEAFPPNRGSSTPASDAVRRTGLQPQVDSHEIHTTAKDEQDKVLAIDAILQQVSQDIPQSASKKISKFKKMWDKMKSKWEELKMNNDSSPQEIETNGLGSSTGDPKLLQYMQNNPNAIVTGPNQVSNFTGVN